MATIAKDHPLAEITLRRYEKPSPDTTQRDIVKKICLSVGLLQPGDSRDVIVDILAVLLNAKIGLDCETIQQKVIDYRKEYHLDSNGSAASNVRRQLRRLRELFFVEKTTNFYRIAENDSLLNLFEEKIEKFYLRSITTRVKEYLKLV